MPVNTIVNFQFKLSSLYQKKARQPVLILGGRLIGVLRKMKPSSEPLKGGLDGFTKVASCKRFLFIYSQYFTVDRKGLHIWPINRG